ncbi:MAG: DUF2809 domain-containing protein [Flavobacterium sp.]|uniref:ribosomal maturation YjgA family protein n=1 Tax=Flavobacterium sp. TaxID=239 RepID=UPI00120D618D|nr:DUF2809 domain-containing protein [Flavobacterium sp.]RZJ68089.1 MAG: DUF2809 domain-containing protein [Flavobacterium sp.]
MITFRRNYFVLAIGIFIVEVLIALYVDDAIIRPYVGDILVVILIYAFVRAFFDVSVKVAAIGTLAFAFFIEFLQFLQIVDKLGLHGNRMARTVIGTSFSWGDLVMYVIGIAIVFLAENVMRKKSLRLP